MTKEELEKQIFTSSEDSFRLIDKSITGERASIFTAMVLLAVCQAAGTDFPGLHKKLFESDD